RTTGVSLVQRNPAPTASAIPLMRFDWLFSGERCRRPLSVVALVTPVAWAPLHLLCLRADEPPPPARRRAAAPRWQRPWRVAANPGMAAMDAPCPTAALGLIPPPWRRAALRAVILNPRAESLPSHHRLCSGGAIQTKELSHLTLDASGGSIRLFPQQSRW